MLVAVVGCHVSTDDVASVVASLPACTLSEKRAPHSCLHTCACVRANHVYATTRQLILPTAECLQTLQAHLFAPAPAAAEPPRPHATLAAAPPLLAPPPAHSSPSTCSMSACVASYVCRQAPLLYIQGFSGQGRLVLKKFIISGT